MANNIYHKSNWGSPEKDDWGDVYFNPSATNKLYTRSDNYENSDGTDKALASKPDTQSVLMTPTAYNVGSMNSILPTNGDGNFTFDRNSTATRVNKEGLIETVAIDTPRLDYPLIDGVVQSEPALLLEPSRTNSIPYSEDFNSVWVERSVTLTSNSVISPDGTQNASTLTINNSIPYLGDLHNIVTTGNTYTISCFVKKGTNRWVRLASYSSATSGAWFDLENGVVGTVNSTSASIEDFGNGWYRITNTTIVSNNNNQAFIGLSDADGGTTSSQIGNTVYIYGAQIEAGSYATSYIPTLGSSVTRSAETANGAGTSDDFNDSEGVLYANIKGFKNDTISRPISINDGGTSDRVQIFFPSNQNQIIGRINSVGATTVDISYDGIIQTLYNKIAFKYNDGDVALWLNGFEVLEYSASANMPVGLNKLSFDNGGTTDFYGKTKELSVFKTALTDSELEALTSWDSFSDMATGQEYTIR